MKDYFTYQGIIRLLKELDSLYGCITLREWKGQPSLILRHDVDLDIGMAHRMAMHEFEAGLRGSFFFLVTCDTYNCQARVNRERLRDIDKNGGEVALHFDPSLYETGDEEGLTLLANREAAILEDILGRRVESVSLHNPSIKNRYPMLAGWKNAYDPSIFNPDIYLSDSRMNFRQDPLEFFARNSGAVRQLLLHPMHYSEEPPIYPRPHLAYLREVATSLDRQFQVNAAYAELVQDRFFDLLHREVSSWQER